MCVYLSNDTYISFVFKWSFRQLNFSIQSLKNLKSGVTFSSSGPIHKSGPGL